MEISQIGLRTDFNALSGDSWIESVAIRRYAALAWNHFACEARMDWTGLTWDTTAMFRTLPRMALHCPTLYSRSDPAS